MLMDELKKQYDSVEIKTIEADCKHTLEVSSTNRKNFILRLYYLERTKRYKENKVYQNEKFETYIMNMFNLRYSTFNKERFAFIAHPVATSVWGAGLIDKIKTECGAGKLSEVIQQIEKDPNITHVEINKIIDGYRKPEAKATTDESKRELEQDKVKKMKMIAEYIQTINEQTAQIERLKDTISKRDAENAEHIQAISTLKAENAEHIQTIKEQTAQILQLKTEIQSLRNQLTPSFMSTVNLSGHGIKNISSDIHV